MNERELKLVIRNENSLSLLKKWLMQNCKFHRKVSEKDEYFQHPCRDFSITDEAIRLREDILDNNESRYHLTYKGPRQKDVLKTREEITINLTNEAYFKTRVLLEKIGFRPIGIVEKYREEYECDCCLVYIDNVKDLGLFVEFELRDEKKSSSIFTILNRLQEVGVELEIVDKTYLELLLTRIND